MGEEQAYRECNMYGQTVSGVFKTGQVDRESTGVKVYFNNWDNCVLVESQMKNLILLSWGQKAIRLAQH